MKHVKSVDISKEGDDIVISDSTGAPTDPSVGDLPKESEQWTKALKLD